MSKIVATLIAGLFVSAAFAQTPAATTTATPAKVEAKAAPAKTEVKTSAEKAHKKASAQAVKDKKAETETK